MKPPTLFTLLTLASTTTALTANNTFNPLHHLGGNSPFFPGPNTHNISPAPPPGCTLDQAFFLSRHGSRYPDPSAHAEWVALGDKIRTANLSIPANASELAFLPTWTPLQPGAQMSELSPTGRQELRTMGAAYRERYAALWDEAEQPFAIWANAYASANRVLDSAREFAAGFLGGGNETATIRVVNGSAPAAVANSLAPSDACPAYIDNGGGAAKEAWDGIWAARAAERLNARLGAPVFGPEDVSVAAYLCGFETQIQQRLSPWCGVLTRAEVEAYEYAQDLRYWYGSGPGSGVGASVMLPLLEAVVRRFEDGPGKVYEDGEGAWVPPALVAAFANDGQVSQLAAAVGVFDGLADLGGREVERERVYRASWFATMRGTVGLERLSCGGEGVFVRVRLNEAVYPVRGCEDGPGRSCGLGKYGELVRKKLEAVGGFGEVCNVTASEGGEETTFLWDRSLPFVTVAEP